jgi:hypothetical protein
MSGEYYAVISHIQFNDNMINGIRYNGVTPGENSAGDLVRYINLPAISFLASRVFFSSLHVAK